MSDSADSIGPQPLAKTQLAVILNWCVYAGIAAYALLAVIGFLGSELGSFDEPLQLLGAREIAEGRTPHRDFWSIYPPLNYYLDALAFRAWSASFMVARLVSAFLYGVAVVVFSRYSNNRLSTQSAALRWATLGLVVFCLTRVLALSQNNAILVAVLVLLYFISQIDRDRQLSRRALIVCGLSSGVLLTMRLNLGLYVVATIGTTVVMTGEPLALRAAARHFRQLLTFAVPVCGPVLLYLLPYGQFAKEVISQLALTPNLILRAGHIVDVSRESAPYWCILAIIGFALACCRLDWRSRRERLTAILAGGVAMLSATLGLVIVSAAQLLLVPYAVPFILIGVLIATQLAWKRFPPTVFVGLCFLIANLHYYLIRADGVHLFILAGAVAIVVAAGIASQPQLPRVAALAMLLWLMMQFPPPINHIGIAQWLWPASPNAIRPALRALSNRHSFLALGDSARLRNGEPLLEFERRFFPDATEISVVRYIDRVAAPNDAVFMGLASHDRTRVNSARLSWILPRPLASRYLELEPGIITSESVQREVVQSLEEGVRWLVLQDTPNTGTAKYPFPRSTVLDQYIAANYKCDVSFGKLQVCCRLQACPSP
ncbi:MAG: hypothetical protein WDO69_22145 [Pseudomonadota bacterium]